MSVAAAAVLMYVGVPRLLAQQAVPRNPPPAPVFNPTTPPAIALGTSRINAMLDAKQRGLTYIPGEVLVKFRSGVTVAGASRALSALPSRPEVGALRWAGDVALLGDASQPDARITAQRLSEQPEVLYAQPNFIRRLPASRSHLAAAVRTAAPAAATRALSVIPNDPDFGAYQWNFALVNAPGAWAINPGATSSVIVAVIDTGVTTTNTTLTMPLWTGQKFEQSPIPYAVSTDIAASRFVSPHDFVFMSSGGPVLDMHGHGTHVASTIGEDTNNIKGLTGLAYNVRIMPLKVCLSYWDVMLARGAAGVTGFAPSDAGGCPDDAIVSAIHYAADNGANIINLSLGGTDASPAEQDALQYAVQHNVFVSIAMGNDANDGNPTEYPAFYASTIDGVMSVSAVGKSQTHAYYSSTGSYNEIAAPGGNDRDPGSGADQGYVWQVTLFSDDSDQTLVVKPRFDRYAEVGYEGTSMATPHVSGLAALLMSQGKTRTPAAVEALIKATAKDLGTTGRDDTFGYGLIQARNALFGFGIAR